MKKRLIMGLKRPRTVQIQTRQRRITIKKSVDVAKARNLVLETQKISSMRPKKMTRVLSEKAIIYHHSRKNLRASRAFIKVTGTPNFP